MAQYNLTKTSLFSATTSSGTGNKTLSALDLKNLMDTNTTIPAVALVPSDVLYLDVDLGKRIQLDSVLLYAEELTELNYINFYYKNFVDEPFTLCEKEVLATSYAAKLPLPKAPQFIRCTVSGTTIGLNELLIFSSDTIVGFGETGTDTFKWLEETPIGYLGTPYPVDIYNNGNSDKFVNAYVCVDYTGQKEDAYIKISETEQGIYKGINDSIAYGNTGSDWDKGTYVNTYLDTNRNSIKLSNKGIITYTYKGKLGSLPLNSSIDATPFGLYHAWTYAADRSKIYTVFFIGTRPYVGTLKLYEYTMSTNTWIFISILLIPSVSINASYMNMAYHNGYIYFSYNETLNFYRYNLLGVVGNYETLAMPTLVGHYPHSNMCATTNYIFKYDYQYYAGTRYFTRYTIATNTWEIKSTNMHSSIDNIYISYMVFDSTRNAIYLYIPNNSGYTWVQKYDINLDIWLPTYFNFSSRISSVDLNVAMSYYNNNLYFIGTSLGRICYVYNVVTDIVTSFSLDTDFYTLISVSTAKFVYCLALPPQAGNASVSLYYVGVLNDSTSLYGYNVPYGLANTLTTLTTASGTYTSDIFTLEDPFKAGYLLVDYSSTLGKTSVSTLPVPQDSTIEVRSSNIEPESIDEIYWALATNYNNTNLLTYNINTGVLITGTFTSTGTAAGNPQSVSICRRTGNIYSFRVFLSTSWGFGHYVHSRSGTEVKYGWCTSDVKAYYGVHWDNNNCIWLYSAHDKTLRHYIQNFSSYVSINVSSFYDYCSDLNGVNAWYTDRSTNTLFKVNDICEVQLTVNLGNIYGVCSTEDHGCWVVDQADLIDGCTVKKIDSYGNIVQTIKTDRPLYSLSHDHSGGFYARAEKSIGDVYHYDSFGICTMTVSNMIGYDTLRGGRKGVLLHSSTLKQISYIDLNTKARIWQKARADVTSWTPTQITYTPDIFSWDINAEHLYRETTTLLPAPHDILWGDSLPWRQISSNNYILPPTKYHQFRLTLQNYDASTTPEVKRVVLAPVVLIQDIPPQKSKPVYVRSDIPPEVASAQFNVRLKVWWSVEN